MPHCPFVSAPIAIVLSSHSRSRHQTPTSATVTTTFGSVKRSHRGLSNARLANWAPTAISVEHFSVPALVAKTVVVLAAFAESRYLAEMKLTPTLVLTRKASAKSSGGRTSVWHAPKKAKHDGHVFSGSAYFSDSEEEYVTTCR